MYHVDRVSIALVPDFPIFWTVWLLKPKYGDDAVLMESNTRPPISANPEYFNTGRSTLSRMVEKCTT